MGYELTGKYVSSTYTNLVQRVSDNYYDGAGNLLNISDASSLDITLINYVQNASLSSDFVWNAGYLDVSVIGGSGVSQAYVDGSVALRLKEASLGSNFIWSGGLLDVSVIKESSVNANLDYGTYEPIVSDTSYIYDACGFILQVIINSSLGIKTIDYVYTLEYDVSTIIYNNYGLISRQITFEKDGDDNIIAMHVINL